jgi:hypothetical protein
VYVLPLPIRLLHRRVEHWRVLNPEK